MKRVKGKFKLQFEGGKIVGLELDEVSKMEISNFIDGFYAGQEIALGNVYGSIEYKIADKIMNRYTNDTTTDRLQVYKLIREII